MHPLHLEYKATKVDMADVREVVLHSVVQVIQSFEQALSRMLTHTSLSFFFKDMR